MKLLKTNNNFMGLLFAAPGSNFRGLFKNIKIFSFELHVDKLTRCTEK